MPTSQNGYPANDITLTAVGLIPGTGRSVRLRKGPAGDLLRWVAAQFHRRVEPIDTGEYDDWGYAERPIRGSTTVLSNHASGTALDINAVKHPQGTKPSANFTPGQINTVHDILAQTEGCVRWGGDYVPPALKDGMHFEIIASEKRCGEVYAKLSRATDWIDMANEQDIENALVNALKRYFSSDEVRFKDGNWADLVSQLRNSTIDLQSKSEAANAKADATNTKLDQLNSNIVALNSNIAAVLKALAPKTP